MEWQGFEIWVDAVLWSSDPTCVFCEIRASLVINGVLAKNKSQIGWPLKTNSSGGATNFGTRGVDGVRRPS